MEKRPKQIPLGRAKNIINNKYNFLTVLYRTENNGNRTQWCCQCDCGNIAVVESGNLISGHTKSCGCKKLLIKPIKIDDVFGELTVIKQLNLNTWECKCSCGNTVSLTAYELSRGRKQCSLQHNTNLIGQKFGRLTVLSKTDRKTKSGGIIWKCQCNCGNVCEVPGSSLRNHTVQSCGCLRKEKAKEATLIDLTGQTFGRWKVLKIAEESANGALWECECQCQNKTHRIVKGTSLRNHSSQSCGCLKSRGEEKITKILLENNIPFIREKTFEDCILPSGKKARFDFYVDNKYIIEYDGEQHFHIFGWNTEENFTKIKKYDKIKDDWCKNNNIPIIRIPYMKYDSLNIDDLILKE